MKTLTNPKNRSVILFLAFLLLAGILRLISPFCNPFIETGLFCVDVIIYEGLIIFWLQSVYTRLLPVRSRTYLILAAALMMFYILLRCFKYRIVENQIIWERYSWYSYYIPLIMIPTTFLMGCCCFIQKDRKRSWFKEWLFLIPAVILIIGVFTNDFHTLAFIPKGSIFTTTGETGTYSYGIIIYMSLAWIVMSMTGGIILLIIVSRRVRNWKRAILPFLSLLAIPLLISFSAITNALFHSVMFRDPEVIIFGLLGSLEACIRNRLIPYNENYSSFFGQMKVPAVITDRDYKPAYHTTATLNADLDKLQESAHNPIYLDEDTRLSGMQLRAGYLFWIEDEKELHQINERLADANETLAQENALIRAENRLRSQKEHIDLRNRIYSRIANELYPTQQKIEKLLDNTSPDDPDFRDAMAFCCVLNAYVKRRSNLLLLSDMKKAVSGRELYLALAESCRYLKYCSVAAAAVGEQDIPFGIDQMCMLYDTFEEVIESLLPYMTTLTVSMTENGLRMAVARKQDKALQAEEIMAKLPVSAHESEGIWYLMIGSAEGGAT